MKQDILTFIGFVIAVPLVLVSTWFGISAVNYHFKSVERDQTEQVRQDWIKKEREANRLIQECYSKGTVTPDGNCYTTK